MKNTFLFSIAVSAILCSAAISCTDKKMTGEPTKDLSVPSQLISVNQGVMMKKEYEEKIASLIKKSKANENYDPTQFAYIELDSLKKYIAFLDQVQKLNKKEISGIRIYYGMYADLKGLKNPGRETFFFAPTMDQSASGKMTDEQKQFKSLQHVPFSIVPKDDKNKFVGEFVPIEGLLFTKDMRMALKTAAVQQAPSNSAKFGSENTSLLLNELQVCPPPAK